MIASSSLKRRRATDGHDRADDAIDGGAPLAGCMLGPTTTVSTEGPPGSGRPGSPEQPPGQVIAGPAAEILSGEFAGPSAARGAQRAFSTRDILSTFFKRGKGSTLIFAATLLLVAAVAFALPPVYEASSTVMVKFGREYVYRPEIGDQRPMIMVTPEEVLNSEVQILTSDDLLDSVISAIAPARLYPSGLGVVSQGDTVRRRFQSALSVDAVNRSTVLRISFRHGDPELAARVVNLLVDAYKEKHLQVFREQNTAFLETQLHAYENSLKDAQRALESFRQEHGVFSYEEQANQLLAARTAQEAAYRDAVVRGTRIRARSLKEMVADLDRQMRELDLRQGQFADAKRTLAESERNYQTYRAKYEEMRIGADLDRQKLGNVSVIQPATPPASPVRPRDSFILAGAVLSTLSALIYAFAAEGLTQAFSAPERAERQLGLPVLATVTDKKRRRRRKPQPARAGTPPGKPAPEGPAPERPPTVACSAAAKRSRRRHR